MQMKDLLPWTDRGRGASGKNPVEEHPMADLQRQMNTLFENFWHGSDRPFANLELPMGEKMPCADVVETGDGVEISVELPGMEQQDIEVALTGDSLTIKGEKKIERQEEKKGYFMSERSYGSVYRSIPLPPGVDTDAAEASFKNGVLIVRLPQTAEAKEKVKRVEVKSA